VGDQQAAIRDRGGAAGRTAGARFLLQAEDEQLLELHSRGVRVAAKLLDEVGEDASRLGRREPRIPSPRLPRGLPALLLEGLVERVAERRSERVAQLVAGLRLDAEMACVLHAAG
jgi:hypothetical protein